MNSVLICIKAAIFYFQKQNTASCKLYFLLLLFCGTSLSANAQNCYEKFYQQGIDAYENLQFEKAISQFKAAKVCDDLPIDHQLDDWINKAQNGYIQAIKKEQARSQSLALTAKSIIELTKNKDATRAFRFAQYAWQKEDIPESRLALYDSYYQLEEKERKNFYIRDVKVADKVWRTMTTGGFIDRGQTIFVSSRFDDLLFLYDFNGNKIAELNTEVEWYTKQAYCEKNNILLTTKFENLKHWVYGFRLKNAKLDTVPVFEYDLGSQEINALAISKSGEQIAVSLYNGETHVLNGQGNFLYQLPKEERGALHLSFSNGNELALAFYKKVKVFRLNNQSAELLAEKELKRISSPKIYFSSSGKYLMAGNRSFITILDVEADTIYSGAQDKSNVAYQSDIGTISDDDEYVTFGQKLIRLKKRQLIEEFSKEVRNMKLSPDLKYLGVNFNNTEVRLWKYPTDEYGLNEYGLLGGHKDFIRQFNFSPDSSHLLTISNDRTFKIWAPDFNAGLYLRYDGQLNQLIESEDDLNIILTSGSSARFLDEKGKQQFYTGIPAAKNIAAVSPDGKYLFVNDNDGFDVWSVDRKENSVRSLFGLSGVDSVSYAEFSKDNKVFFYMNQNYTYSLQYWDLNSQERQYVSGYDTDLEAIHWSPDNQHLAALDYEGKIYVWKIGDKAELLHKWNLPADGRTKAFSFAPDGKHLMTCGFDGTTKLWTLKGELKNSLIGHVDKVNDVAFSKDGKYILTGSDDKTAKIWSKDGELIKSIENRNNSYSGVSKVLFSDNGRYIGLVYEDKSFLILPFDPNLIIEKLEALGLPDLSDEEKEKYGISLD